MLYAPFTFFLSTPLPAFILVLACAPFFGACLDRYLTSSSAVFYWSFPYEHNDSNRALLYNSLPPPTQRLSDVIDKQRGMERSLIHRDRSSPSLRMGRAGHPTRTGKSGQSAKAHFHLKDQGL